MIRTSICFVGICATIASLSKPCFAVTNASSGAPLRHLVYSFTYGVQGDLTVHTEMPNLDPSTSGLRGLHDYNGSMQDKGTITIDVMREQPDTGLIVTVSEDATESRKADSATCVTYGTTNVICDPNKRITSEELSLLQLIGRNFVDPSKMDDKGHWRLEQSNGTVATVADYTVSPGKNGIASIQETKVINELGVKPTTTDVTATIAYDLDHAIPTSVQEYVIERQSSSTAGSMRTTYQTSLTLVSDSMAKP
jgi:hypothetical protein